MIWYETWLSGHWIHQADIRKKNLTHFINIHRLQIVNLQIMLWENKRAWDWNKRKRQKPIENELFMPRNRKLSHFYFAGFFHCVFIAVILIRANFAVAFFSSFPLYNARKCSMATNAYNLNKWPQYLDQKCCLKWGENAFISFMTIRFARLTAATNRRYIRSNGSGNNGEFLLSDKCTDCPFCLSTFVGRTNNFLVVFVPFVRSVNNKEHNLMNDTKDTKTNK